MVCNTEELRHFSPHYINTVCQLESFLWMAVKWKRRLSEYKLRWIISALFCIALRVCAGFRATRLKPLTIHQGCLNNTNECGLHYCNKCIYTHTNTESEQWSTVCEGNTASLTAWTDQLWRCVNLCRPIRLSSLLLQIAKHAYLLIKTKEIFIPPWARRSHTSILFNYALV